MRAALYRLVRVDQRADWWVWVGGMVSIAAIVAWVLG